MNRLDLASIIIIVYNVQEANKRRKFERYRNVMQTALEQKVQTRQKSAQAKIGDILVSPNFVQW